MLSRVSKMIGGATAGLAAGAGGALIVVPEGAEMPWWGYLLVGLANAAIIAVGVYLAPANALPRASPAAE